jgi:hypothetical protein
MPGGREGSCGWTEIPGGRRGSEGPPEMLIPGGRLGASSRGLVRVMPPSPARRFCMGVGLCSTGSLLRPTAMPGGRPDGSGGRWTMLEGPVTQDSRLFGIPESGVGVRGAGSFGAFFVGPALGRPFFLVWRSSSGASYSFFCARVR